MFDLLMADVPKMKRSLTWRRRAGNAAIKPCMMLKSTFECCPVHSLSQHPQDIRRGYPPALVPLLSIFSYHYLSSVSLSHSTPLPVADCRSYICNVPSILVHISRRHYTSMYQCIRYYLAVRRTNNGSCTLITIVVW